MELIKWLERWYESNCNGDWEHSSGITISTLDNPGWMVEISLTDTSLENKDFEIKKERSDNDWVYCKIENSTFKGYGGVHNLSEVIQIFKDICNEK